MHRSSLAVAALAVSVPLLAGCSSVKNNLGVKTAPTATSDRSVYAMQVSQTCQATKATYDTDGRRLSADANTQTQAVDIERIIQDYRDLRRTLDAIPAPTTGTAHLALDTANRTIPDLGALQDKADKLRMNTVTLSPKDITDITTALPSDFCANLVLDVTGALPAA